MGTNIFVLGLDELNHQALKKLPGAENYTFHQLLTFDELQGGSIAVNELLEEAERRLEDFDGSIDAEIGGSAAMMEEEASGSMLTVEGFSYQGEVEVYGVIDSHTYEGTSSFLRYQYPSQLPEDVQQRIADVSKRVIKAVRLDHSTFNIEYFWEEQTQKLRLLEINSRHSQSHAQLFQLVDGRPNHACMVDLGLGREPQMPAQNGEFRTAATWFLRRFEDGYIKRVPTAEEVRAIEQKYPGTTIQIDKEADRPLSGDPAEDAYSFALAEIFTAGQSEEEMIETYEKVIEELNFEIEDL